MHGDIVFAIMDLSLHLQHSEIRITSLRKGKMSVVLTTISLGTFFAPSISIGISTLHFIKQDCANVSFSIRTKLWNADPEYSMTSHQVFSSDVSSKASQEIPTRLTLGF
jgi:hypothetical protein